MGKTRTEVSSKDHMEVISKTRTEVVRKGDHLQEVTGKICTEVISKQDHCLQKTDMQVISQKDTQVISTRRSISVAVVVVGEPAPSSQAEVSMALPALWMALVMLLRTLSVAVAMALPLPKTAGITPLVTLPTMAVVLTLQGVVGRMHPSDMMPTEILRPGYMANEDA